MRSLPIFVLVLAACSAGPPGAQSAVPAERQTTLTQLAALPGVVALHRDVALVCEAAPAHSDAADAIPDCDAALVGADGAATPLGRGNLLAAQRLAPGRLLLLTRDLRLLSRDEQDGHEQLLARAAADPRVGDDGRIVYTELPAGTTELTPGLPGRIVLLDLARGTRRVVTEDRAASSPFVVPGTDEVLFVSARTGIASLWLAAPAQPPRQLTAARQLTNIGLTRVDARFVPVPRGELAFAPGGRQAVYTASYGGAHELWRLDLDTGAAERLGPGRFPRFVDATLVAAAVTP